MMKTDADRGQAPVSQGAHTSPHLVTEATVAARTRRACPQINNTCFQTNRARGQADANGSRDGYGANVKLRKLDSEGSNSAKLSGAASTDLGMSAG